MCCVRRNVWGGGNRDVGGGMSGREVVVMSGVGGSLTLGERMRQALGGDTTFCPASRVSEKSEIDENTAGCGDVDGKIGATTAAGSVWSSGARSTGARIARGAEVSTDARDTGARVASGLELVTGSDM